MAGGLGTTDVLATVGMCISHDCISDKTLKVVDEYTATHVRRGGPIACSSAPSTLHVRRILSRTCHGSWHYAAVATDPATDDDLRRLSMVGNQELLVMSMPEICFLRTWTSNTLGRDHHKGLVWRLHRRHGCRCDTAPDQALTCLGRFGAAAPRTILSSFKVRT